MKNGESDGEVQITLSSGNPDKPLRVKRRIKTDNTSDWFLNGALSPRRVPTL